MLGEGWGGCGGARAVWGGWERTWWVCVWRLEWVLVVVSRRLGLSS